MSERELIARLAQRFAAGGVEVGIGDDAAVLAGGVVLSVDSQVEGVHFRREWLSLEDIGYRATMAAASDLAAMGAQPTAVLAAVVLPDEGLLDGLTAGQALACSELEVPLVGGNLSRGGELSIATTVVGRSERPLLRSGACDGDGVFVCGALGMASAGLRALQRGEVDGYAVAVAAWRRPKAQIAAGLAAAASQGVVEVRAAIDISDGLATDAGHVAEASGVALVLDAEALVTPELATFAQGLTCDPVALASGGEDYALLVCGRQAPAGFRRIGRCEAGAGVWLERGGERQRWTGGFDHFD